MKRHLRAILARTPLWGPYRRLRARQEMRLVRRTYSEWTDVDERRAAFYGQFVEAGDVVFDVGANIGNRTKVFAHLGATVVAVEPQRGCGDFLEEAYGGETHVHVVRAALGASVGEADMQVSTWSALSSLSPSWIEAVRASGRHADALWTHSERVPVDTLDRLIDRYGLPTFVKIDVEGFEADVIAGLSVPVAALSMEFHSEHVAGARRWLAHLSGIADYRFQLSFGESLELTPQGWLTASEFDARLDDLPDLSWGDAYARLEGSPPHDG
ncbi:MAG TPA: FkbM family methyltransferase [Acidimicrobiia bacterium]|nr:FkbM family methyltransferase [Acidimicrobiia bacterium]